MPRAARRMPRAARRSRITTADPASEPEETGPLRRCLVSRERAPKAGMIRFVIGPDGAVVPDLAATLPGRGLWLSARADVIETACKRGAFAKAARAAVTVPADLPARLREGVERRIVETLGLARRAGQAVAGHDKAGAWLREGRAALVVQACDGSPEERRRFLGGREMPVVTPLPAATLGAAFGRERAVHVAVAPGRLAGMLQTEAGRLAGLRGTTTEPAGGSPGPDDRQAGTARQAG